MMKNHYLNAIHSEPDGRTEAMFNFANFEMERLVDLMESLENDDGTIPDEHSDQWNLHKGSLDQTRMFAGALAQAMMVDNFRNAGRSNAEETEYRGPSEN